MSADRRQPINLLSPLWFLMMDWMYAELTAKLPNQLLWRLIFELKELKKDYKDSTTFTSMSIIYSNFYELVRFISIHGGKWHKVVWQSVLMCLNIFILEFRWQWYIGKETLPYVTQVKILKHSPFDRNQCANCLVLFDLEMVLFVTFCGPSIFALPFYETRCIFFLHQLCFDASIGEKTTTTNHTSRKSSVNETKISTKYYLIIWREREERSEMMCIQWVLKLYGCMRWLIWFQLKIDMLISA